MTEIKLLPCPYCNSEAHIESAKDLFFFGICNKCGLHGPSRLNRDDAMAAWDNLPRKIKTLNDNPIVDSGFYFLLTEENEVKMCYVYSDIFSNQMCFQTIGDSRIYKVEEVSGVWAGPVSEPRWGLV